jgi:tetratricopeptide (TPR) repeat protein
MDQIRRLAVSIASRDCVLFAGSGLTRDSGGATWSELVQYIVKEFNYSSPLLEETSANGFDIMQDVIRDNGQENVANAIRKRLQDAKIPEKYLDLVKLPWFAVFTTNYDLALEKNLREYQNLILRVIATGNEFQLDGLSSELLCVKLMGSIDISNRANGSMILDRADLEIAMDERNSIFRTLAAHAANKSFLFFGYSFSDNLFLTTLNKLSKIIGEVPNTYYAIFPEYPPTAVAYRLLKSNIEIIVDTPENFVKKLANEVSLRNPGDMSKKRIQIGSNIIQIDSTRIGRFLELYHPVLFDELEEHIEIKSFFYGSTASLKPFNNEWHFKRSGINKIIQLIGDESGVDTSFRIISVLGFSGTGRTFAILAAINELIRNYNSLAVRIPYYSINKIPTWDELDNYIEEVTTNIKEGDPTPERIIFVADFELDFVDMQKFIDLINNSTADGLKIPIFLIIESLSNSEHFLHRFLNEKVRFVKMDLILDDAEKKDLKEYLLNTVKRHKFFEISADELDGIINHEKLFLPIIYRTLDPAKRSINRIIEEEYQRLAQRDPRIKDCISFCALSSFFRLPIPFSILKGGLEDRAQKQLSNLDIFEITDSAKTFIKEVRDMRRFYSFSMHHELIANWIVALNGISITDAYLVSLAKSIDLRIKNGAEFFTELYIDIGVNSDESKPFSATGLLDSFESIRRRQPARPILHHLARLYERNDPNDERIIPLLDEALREPIEKYFLIERKENILTTKAKNMWNRDRDNLSNLTINDENMKKIFDLLEQARSSRSPNPHPYDVQASIMLELAKNKEEFEKYDIIDKAIDLLNDGLEKFEIDLKQKDILERRLIECISLIDPIEAEKRAENLVSEKSDGTGFYILAIIEYYQKKNYEKSLEYLDKALKSKDYPLKAISLNIEILLSRNSPDYYQLLNLADKIPESVFTDTWKTAYHKGIIYAINGFPDAANRNFQKAIHLVVQPSFRIPKYIFWMERGRRKTFSGIISTGMQRRFGQIYSHNIPNWDSDIFFSPISQEGHYSLKAGMNINFELGFNIRGPIAFDIRPFKKSIRNDRSEK